MVKIVYDSDFDVNVLQSTLPVLVEFGASWCGPCVRQLPILEKFAQNNIDKINVVKIDIDESPLCSGKFRIKSVPTLMLFVNGKNINMKTGLTTLTDLNTFIFGNLAQ